MFGFGETPQHGGAEKNTKADASVNVILAVELEKLSLKEREKVYEDVHGVSDVVQETPELIASCLQEMDHEINLIEKKDAYEQAKLQSFSFVYDRQFRLAFLRCTSFNPRTAASHLVQYFSKRLEIFGTEKLTKSNINLEDIGEKATRVVELGSMQILPNRDSKGRAVVVSMPVALEPAMTVFDDPVPIMMKAFWYLMSTLAEDEETQKKGVVFVSNRASLSERLTQCHRASISEALAIAQEFPFTEDGCIKLTNHFIWLKKRRKKEAYLSRNPLTKGAVDLPSKHDVLLGRGKHISRHAGNRLLHELVATYYNEYNRLPKDGKTNLADQVVGVVHGYAGRFLKFDNESAMWIEVSNLEAREKVAHRFRHNRALSLKGDSTQSLEQIVGKPSEETDGGGKRSRIMFDGS
eukprot:scaffold675_cov103-Cylindrotheca_fusiformis.AAC.2